MTTESPQAWQQSGFRFGISQCGSTFVGGSILVFLTRPKTIPFLRSLVISHANFSLTVFFLISAVALNFGFARTSLGTITLIAPARATDNHWGGAASAQKFNCGARIYIRGWLGFHRYSW
jgi:hypothetical protein